MTRLKVAFRNFAKARNKESNYNFFMTRRQCRSSSLSADDL